MAFEKELERNMLPYLRKISSSLKGEPESERKRIVGIIESNICRAMKRVSAEELKAIRDDVP